MAPLRIIRRNIFDRNRPLSPTGIALSSTTVAVAATNGTVIGAITATDPNVGDTVTYTLTSNPAGKTAISGTNLVVAGAPLSATTYPITIAATDQYGLRFEQNFTITAA